MFRDRSIFHLARRDSCFGKEDAGSVKTAALALALTTFLTQPAVGQSAGENEPRTNLLRLCEPGSALSTDAHVPREHPSHPLPLRRLPPIDLPPTGPYSSAIPQTSTPGPPFGPIPGSPPVGPVPDGRSDDLRL